MQNEIESKIKKKKERKEKERRSRIMLDVGADII